MEESYTVEELAKLIRSKKETVNKELKPLIQIKLITQKACTRESVSGKGKNAKTTKKKTKCYQANETFPHMHALKRLLLDISPADEKELISRLSKVASIKLLLISGVFIQENEARVDLFIVADKIKSKSLEKAVTDIESYVGSEIKFVAFSPEDFNYRLSMYDKLVRDVLDFPYKVLINKLQDNSWQEVSMV